MGSISLEYLFSIQERLEKEYPERGSLLMYENLYQLTVAVALSAQTTDAGVNRVTPELFQRWPNPKSLASADIKELENLIHPLGFFHQKARNLIAAAERVVDIYGGEIPREMNQLTSLPGIGRKSANVIRAHVWNLPGIIVDTHFGRVCRRLGLTLAENPDKVERELSALVPDEMQNDFSMMVNYHGRRYCMAKKPNCRGCPLNDICPQVGVAFKKILD
ncbi:MAG: endonuclease III [Spirochaetes bacterium]|nr:MAG: endonuclease III [Spirochaetota bacterium]